MRAAVLYEARTPMCIEDVSVDGPKDDEVLVQIRATGACHSDYHVINGSWTDPASNQSGRGGGDGRAETGSTGGPYGERSERGAEDHGGGRVLQRHGYGDGRAQRFTEVDDALLVHVRADATYARAARPSASRPCSDGVPGLPP